MNAKKYIRVHFFVFNAPSHTMHYVSTNNAILGFVYEGSRLEKHPVVLKGGYWWVLFLACISRNYSFTMLYIDQFQCAINVPIAFFDVFR